MTEIQDHQEEEATTHVKLQPGDLNGQNGGPRGIQLTNVSFRYEGPQSPYVLKDINLFIPEGKVTAIVGGSGSGKSTLIKLLLKFYAPVSGTVSVNQHNLLDISPVNWRQHCGVVTQEGYLFSDTIERNIATSEVDVDGKKFANAVRIANIGDFIGALPLKEKTKVGSAGNGISGGQKQRLLIARAVYKKPHFIFLDEATSALDTENEKTIHDNLKAFFRGKTVVIVAHRLSTVKSADQIIVLRNGQIAEQGNHNSLVNRQGEYFNLVKNQLELEVAS
jgi:ATP-binding cassette subfamily B protein